MVSWEGNYEERRRGPRRKITIFYTPFGASGPAPEPFPLFTAPGGAESQSGGIRELILAARQTVSRGVDLVQVNTCFEIGRHIVDQEQQGKGRAEYGGEVLIGLSEKLTAEFGKGFSRSNLEYMRWFYLAYST